MYLVSLAQLAVCYRGKSGFMVIPVGEAPGHFEDKLTCCTVSVELVSVYTLKFAEIVVSKVLLFVPYQFGIDSSTAASCLNCRCNVVSKICNHIAVLCPFSCCNSIKTSCTQVSTDLTQHTHWLGPWRWLMLQSLLSYKNSSLSATHE